MQMSIVKVKDVSNAPFNTAVQLFVLAEIPSQLRKHTQLLCSVQFTFLTLSLHARAVWLRIK
jgi:hypothetical protein